MEVLIFYGDKLMAMGNYKNLRVFNRKNLMLAKYTCLTVRQNETYFGKLTFFRCLR